MSAASGQKNGQSDRGRNYVNRLGLRGSFRLRSMGCGKDPTENRSTRPAAQPINLHRDSNVVSYKRRRWPKNGQSDQNRNNAIRARCPLVRRRHPQGLKAGLGEPENNVVSYKASGLAVQKRQGDAISAKHFGEMRSVKSPIANHQSSISFPFLSDDFFLRNFRARAARLSPSTTMISFGSIDLSVSSDGPFA